MVVPFGEGVQEVKWISHGVTASNPHGAGQIPPNIITTGGTDQAVSPSRIALSVGILKFQFRFLK